MGFRLTSILGTFDMINQHIADIMACYWIKLILSNKSTLDSGGYDYLNII